MKFCKDNETVAKKNKYFEAAACMVLGDRAEQQDCYGMEISDDSGIFVICDGMGGYAGGKKASNTVVDSILNSYSKKQETVLTPNELQQYVYEANRAVLTVKEKNKKNMNAGTTCVFVYIYGHNLYWCSVGDSRAYILRKGKYYQITQDHNYKTVLDGQLKLGLIKDEEYQKELAKGESLINFLGMQQIDLIDYNTEPLEVRSNDRVVLMSDGVYKFLEEDSIFKIIENFNNPLDAVLMMNKKIEKQVRDTMLKRDNMSIAVIQIL